MPRTIVMPSAEEIDKAYKEAIRIVPERYKRRVQLVRGWKERAIEGEETYKEKMMKVIEEERRKRGLERISEEDWRKGAVEKGAKIIGRHMEFGAEKRRKNYEPFRNALDGLEIPDKGPDPVENARTIVPVVVEALVRKKRELLGLE